MASKGSINRMSSLHWELQSLKFAGSTFKHGYSSLANLNFNADLDLVPSNVNCLKFRFAH